MKHQKVKEKISAAKIAHKEENRAALARLKARMMATGQLRLERQIDQIVLLATGVRP